MSHDRLPASCAAPTAAYRTGGSCRRPAARPLGCPCPGGDPDSGRHRGCPPAQPTNLQASAEHDAVTLTWTASTDQTVTHYAILRRNRDTDALGVFHVIDSNAGTETSYTDRSVAAASRYNYRVKAVSPTGVSKWSGFVKADTPAAPTPTPTLPPRLRPSRSLPQLTWPPRT